MKFDGTGFPWPIEGDPVVRQLLPDMFEVTAVFYVRSVEGVAVTQLPAAR